MKHNTRLRIIKTAFAFVLIALLFVPATATHPQIDMRAMVVALGLDHHKDGVKAVVEIVLPVEGGGSIGASEIVSGNGASLNEAFENISISLGRKLELNHCGIIVIGKQKAQDGFLEELEFLLSAGVVSPQTNLAMSGNKDSEEFLKLLKDYSKKLDLSNLLRYTDIGAQNYSKGLVHFIKEVYSKSNASAIPCITMGTTNKEQEQEGQQEGQQSPQKGAEDSAENEQVPALIQNLKSTAVFGGELGSLKGIWGEKATKGGAFLDDKTKEGYVFLSDVEAGGRTIKNLSLKINKKKVKTSVSLRDGIAVCKIKLSMDLKAEDKHGLGFLRYDNNRKLLNAVYPQIADLAKEEIADSITQAFDNAKRDKSDLFKINDMLYRLNHKQYKRMINDGADPLKDAVLDMQISIDLT